MSRTRRRLATVNWYQSVGGGVEVSEFSTACAGSPAAEVSVTNVWVVVCTACASSATGTEVSAVSNSRRVNANKDHAAGAPAGASGALPAADGSSKRPNRFDTALVTILTGSAGMVVAAGAA